jgi:hypothetical protein
MRRSAIVAAFIAIVILAAGILVKGTVTQPAIGNWLAAGSMTAARSGAASALLQDGRILITGGDNGSGPVASAEFFDTTGSLVAAPLMGTARSAHSATVLTDGRILVAGGSTGAAATNAAEIFDPAANEWTPVAGGMIQARSNHTASLLADGRVLFAGGDNAGAATAALEIFDPASNAFSSVGVMTSARTSFASAILSDGRVMLIGGSNGSAPVASTEIFDPVSNTVAAGPALSAPRMAHSATTLLDGRVLVAGGTTVVTNPDGSTTNTDLASAEIYDPATGNFAVSASSLAAPRRDHKAFLLPNNNSVLIVGGTSAGAEVTTAELFLPSTGTFAVTGSPSVARQHSTGSALSQDGILFLAGGSNSTGTLATTELYGFATVKTDKADYAPGSIVTITGSGWQPGETVSLIMVESPLFDTHGPFTAVADSTGRISNNQFSPDEHDESIRFYLTAVGSVSGIQAQNTFTDSKPNTVTVSTQAPNPVAPGVSATYTVTVNFNGNGSSCTSPLSIQTPSSLPAGASPTFAPSSLTSTGGNATSTLTISTTNATPPGSFPFTVLAANGGGSCQSGTATGNGTLVVVENTTTTLASSLNPSVFGQSTTLTATVAQVTGPTTPTGGTVTFKDGATTIGTATLSNGTASIAVSNLTVAGSPHSLTASYAGVANTFGPSNSTNTVSQQVNQASTTTTVATSGTPSTYGNSVTFTATVTPQFAGVTAPSGTVTFKDGATTIGTGTLNGLNPDTATFATSNLAVGSHSITALYGADTNYTGSTSSSITQSVTQKSVTPSITASNKTYDATTTATTACTLTGVLAGDTGNVTCAAATATFADKNVGTGKTVTATGITLSGSAAGNYTLSSTTATTTANIIALALTVTAAANSKTYDATTSAAATPTITSGTLQGTDTANFTETYNNKNVGTGKTLTPSGTATDGNGGANYSYTFVASANGTIIARVLTVTAATNTKPYDGTTSAAATPTITSGALQGTDAANFTETYDTKNAGTGKTLTPAGTANDGNSGNNYAYTFVTNTTGIITARAITVTAATNTKLYDGTTTAAATPTITSGTLVAGDTANFTEAYATKNAGTGKTLTPAGTVNDGNGGANYNVSFVNNTTGVITAKGLTVTAITANSKTFDGTTAATLNTGTAALVGVVALDVVTLNTAGATGTFATANAGTGITVTVSGLTIGGGDAGNYTLTQPTTTANITQAAPSVAVTGGTFTYDGNQHAATATATGVGGANVSGTFAFTYTPPGNTTVPTNAGTYSVSASFTSTDPDYANASGTGSLTINKATPIFSPALSSPAAIPFGRATVSLPPVSVMVVAGGARAASPDTVTITINNVSSGAIPFNGASGTFGPINFDTHAIPAGSYPITYVYSGGTNFNSITDGSTTLAVTKVTPTVTWATPAAITFNTALSATQLNATFTAIVNGVSGPVAGTATYTPAAGTILNAGAGQTLSVNFVPTDTTDYNNASGSVLITVNKAATSTAVTSNNNPSFSGQSVTFTATVTNTSLTSGVPTGSVQFFDGASALGSPQPLAAGTATLTTSALTVAIHSITAVYTNSDGNFIGSTSAALSQTVKSADTTTSISAPAITFGANGLVTVTVAAVDASAGTPTGNVTLSVDGGTAVGQALVSGSTTFTVSNPSAGDHLLVATYAAQNNFNASTATGNLHVNQAQATLSFDNLTFTYDGSPKPVSVTTSPANLTGVTILYNGSATPPTAAGGTPVSATLTNTNYTATPINGTEVIQQAQATVTFVQLTFAYDGTAKTATVTTNPLGLTVNITYSQNNNPVTSPTAAGSYAVSATIVDNNYQGSATGTLVISQANLYVIPNDQTRNFSDANPTAFPASYLGFASGDNAGNSVSGTLTCQIAATSTSSAGQYAIHGCSGLSSANYNLVYANGTLTITNPLVSLAVTPVNPTIHIGETQPFVAVGTFQQGSRNLRAFGGAWANGSSMPTARVGAAAAEVNGQLYVISGTDGSTVINSVDVYNPVTGTWANPSPVPAIATGRAFARAIALGGQLYVIGGCTVADCSNITGTVEVYDPNANSWSAKASMPSGTERYDAAVGVINGKLYVAGGHNAGGVIGTVEIYNPVTDTWTSGQSMGTARSAAAAGVINGLLYVAGGSDGGGPVNTLQSYDPVLDSWTPLTASPAMAAQSFAGGAVLNGMLYAVSGIDGGSNPTGAVQAYDPVANSWANQTPIPTGLNDGQPVAIGGVIYAAGNGSGNTLQVYSPNEVIWNSATPSVATADATGLATAVAAGTSTITGTSIPFSPINGSTVLTVNKKVQTITFGALADKTYGDADFTVSATSDSGLTVSFLASGNCTVSGTTVDITGAGSCTITAQQAGNATFDAATDVARTFNIAKAHLSVKADDKSKTYDGAVFTAFTATITGFVKSEDSGVVSGAPSFTGTATTAVNAGSYTITPGVGNLTAANYDFTNFYNGTLTINKATPTVSVSFATSPITYDGNSHSATTAVTGVGGADLTTGHGSIAVTYTPGAATAPLNAGSYSAAAHFTSTDNNYTDADSTIAAALVIKKAVATVVVTPYTVTYDGLSHTAKVTSISGVNGETGATVGTVDVSNTTHTTAGTYSTDYWSFSGAANYYNIANTTIQDVINKATAVVVVTPYNVVYDGNPHTAMVASITGVNGETGATVGTVDVSHTTHTDAGTYSSDYWTFTGAANYNDIASTTIQDVINKADATIVVNGFSGQYDAIAHGATGTAKGVKGEDLSALLSLGAAFTDVPGGTAHWTFAGNTDYKAAAGDATITITQAPSSVAITCPAGVTYNGMAQTPCSANVTGINLSQILAVVYMSNTNAGLASASAAFAGDNNHTGNTNSTTFMISPAPTSASVSTSPNPSNWGDVVTLTATVSNTNNQALPTGNVSFYNAASGATCAALGTSTLLDTEPLTTVGSSQQAATSTPNLPVGPGNTVGTDNILACFNNNMADPNFNANFMPSNAAVTQTVNPAPIVTLVPTNLSFGNQQGGTTSGAQPVTVCNGPGGVAACSSASVSTAALSIASIGFTNSNTSPVYFTQSNTCPMSPATLSVGGSCVINVKFAPPATASGLASALVTLTDNNRNVTGSFQSASLTGSGTSSISGVGSLSTYALFATASGCSSVSISGNGTVDSYNGLTNSGNVGTNGNATLSGNPVVNGAIYSPVAGSGNCSSKTMTGLGTSGKAQATGGLKALPAPVNYPLPPAPSPAPPTTTQNISGSCGTVSGCSSAGGSKSVNLAPGGYGNLSASGGTTLHLSAGTYNFNSLTLSGNSILYVDSGPVIINLAGASLSASGTALDLSGGSIVNPSEVTSNLQIYYAGSKACKVSGGTGSYAMVYAPNAAINISGGAHFYGSIIGSTINSSGNTAVHYDAAETAINMGQTIWFNSSGLNVQGLPNTGSVKLYITNATITFTANSIGYTLAVPNAVITFSSSASSASTTWDAANNRWSTLIPMSSVKGNATIHSFFDGLAYQVPTNFPGGIQNVTWQAAYSTSTPGLNFNWQWGAAVYGAFGPYNTAQINPLDNADPAGTPESQKGNLVFGDMGAGYTGLYAGTTAVVPTIAPLSFSQSSLDFGMLQQGVTSTQLTAILTNNDSVPYAINAMNGIQYTGTYAGDFTITNNCPISPNSLAAGGSCTFTVTLTPSAATSGTKETAKIVVNDNANNSPQTVFLKGTVQ